MAKMGRKTMLAKVATAAAEGIDPRDFARLKTKVLCYKPLLKLYLRVIHFILLSSLFLMFLISSK